MNHLQPITRETLIEVGRLSAAEVDALYKALDLWDGDTMPWIDVAKYDGLTALRVLPREDFKLIGAALVGSGLPADIAMSTGGAAQAIFSYAASIAPSGKLEDPSLTSSVALAVMLKLIEEASEFSEEGVADAEARAFAEQLGIKLS